MAAALEAPGKFEIRVLQSGTVQVELLPGLAQDAAALAARAGAS
jgi:hypothetical protein